MTLSIVVPTLREAHNVPALAEHLRAVAPDAEVLLVDGDSDDGTADVARQHGLRVVEGCRGRWSQMNLGAAETSGRYLLFLHVDTELPVGAPTLVAETLADPGVALGAFGFRFDARGLRIGFVELGAKVRNAVRPTPYGDQGLFLRREVFDAIGGFAPMSVMEDFDLVERARKLGRIVVRPEPATTSARRYVERGPLRLMLRHWVLSARFLRGWRPGMDEVISR